MKLFVLRRVEDVNGVSGTGIVVQGVVFDDGTVALRWLSNLASTCVYNSIEDVIAIHGHEGRTRVEWLDAEPTGVRIPVKLGWSNEDTGPESMRLYATDVDDQPRWTQPHARVAETAIKDQGLLTEGRRGVVILDGE